MISDENGATRNTFYSSAIDSSDYSAEPVATKNAAKGTTCGLHSKSRNTGAKQKSITKLRKQKLGRPRKGKIAKLQEAQSKRFRSYDNHFIKQTEGGGLPFPSVKVSTQNGSGNLLKSADANEMIMKPTEVMRSVHGDGNQLFFHAKTNSPFHTSPDISHSATSPQMKSMAMVDVPLSLAEEDSNVIPNCHYVRQVASPQRLENGEETEKTDHPQSEQFTSPKVNIETVAESLFVVTPTDSSDGEIYTTDVQVSVTQERQASNSTQLKSLQTNILNFSHFDEPFLQLAITSDRLQNEHKINRQTISKSRKSNKKRKRGKKYDLHSQRRKQRRTHSHAITTSEEEEALFEALWVSKREASTKKYANCSTRQRHHSTKSCRETDCQSYRFRINDIVWAKMVDRPWWPAKILSFERDDAPLNYGIFNVSIQWLGKHSSVTEVLPSSLISPFADTFHQHYLPGKTASTYVRAIQAALDDTGYRPRNSILSLDNDSEM